MRQGQYSDSDDVLFILLDKQLKAWADINITNASATQIGRTIKMWILKTDKNKLVGSSLFEYFLKPKMSINCFVSEETGAALYNSEFGRLITIEKAPHHLLPGVLARIPPSIYHKVSTYIKPFPELFHALKSIHHLIPPESHTMLQFNPDNLDSTEPKLDPLAEITEETPTLVQRTLFLPSTGVSYLIGRKGETIQNIRQKTTATIKIHSPSNSHDQDDSFNKENHYPNPIPMQTIVITGPLPEVETAVSLVEAQLHKWSQRAKNH